MQLVACLRNCKPDCPERFFLGWKPLNPPFIKEKQNLSVLQTENICISIITHKLRMK